MLTNQSNSTQPEKPLIAKFINYNSVPNARAMLSNHLFSYFTVFSSLFTTATATAKVYIIRGAGSATQYYYGFDSDTLGDKGMQILANSNATIIAECDDACNDFPKDTYKAICSYGTPATGDDLASTYAMLVRAIADLPNKALETDICKQLDEIFKSDDPTGLIVVASIIGGIAVAAAAGAGYRYRESIKDKLTSIFSKTSSENTENVEQEVPTERSALLKLNQP